MTTFALLKRVYNKNQLVVFCVHLANCLESAQQSTVFLSDFFLLKTIFTFPYQNNSGKMFWYLYKLSYKKQKPRHSPINMGETCHKFGGNLANIIKLGNLVCTIFSRKRSYQL